MNRATRVILALWIGLLTFAANAQPEGPAPWGKGELTEREYKPNKVVYDVAVNSTEKMSRVLDRASYLSTLYHADPFESSIVLVLHGNEIPFFAVENYERYKDLVVRAQSLTVGTTIEIRMCAIAAKGHGYDPEEIHGFVQLVPMADAEIVRLQREEGYAYMR